ncbi:DedA family protein [Demetria terragena]|uniref:DedA family protein n=1 Tax=Demetria terragena TaxID=63959 RepID=UPI000A021F05|nr:VTT domain-containing protein [Demetria terragena]
MIDLIQALLEQAGAHIPLLLGCTALFAAADSALGIGAIAPGETGLVLVAVALADRTEFVLLAVVAAALGAFIGDHVGFVVGRRLGPRLGETTMIRRLGVDRWDRARDQVAGNWVAVLVARLLPGIRTFVPAAAGASTMTYARFAWVCALAALVWAAIWIAGGAIVGAALLELAERYSLAFAAVAVAAAAGWLLLRRTKASRV